LTTLDSFQIVSEILVGHAHPLQEIEYISNGQSR